MMRSLLLSTTIFLFSFVIRQAFAEDIQRIGVPYVQNYTKADYKAGNQNWAVACGKNGMIYTANADGMLAFDGQYWRQYAMPGRVVIRSIAVDSNDRIYTGGFAEFGFWEDAGFGQLTYHSVSSLLDKTDAVKDEVWKIYPDGNRVLFQSFSALYIYENNAVRRINTGAPYLFLHQVKSKLFVELLQQGLHELKGDRLIPADTKKVLKGANILTMLPFAGGKTLIGTSKNGLFLMDSIGLITAWPNQANDLLKKYQLNNGLKLQGGYYAFGTILSGILIVDEAGELVQHINKSNGLQNNTVLSLRTDLEQNIWAGLDNGIDRIDIHAPLYYYSDKTGSIGTVYAAVIYGGNIYLGTNQGLFYSSWGDRDFDFKLVGNSQGQVWDLMVVNGELLCGHNDGTFRVQGNQFIPISKNTGGWCFRPIGDGSGRLFQGTYNGVTVVEKTTKGWTFKKLANFGEPAQYLEPGKNGQLWTSSYMGLRQLILDDSFSTVTQVRAFGPEHGLPKSLYTNVFNLNGTIVFATDTGFFLYDEIADRFTRYELLNQRLGSFSRANKIIPAGENNYWFIRRGKLSLIGFGTNGNMTVDSTRFAGLNDRMLPYYENVSRVRDDLYLISMDDGFAIFRNNRIKPGPLTLPAPLLRGVEDITDSASFPILYVSGSVEIAYARNNIRLSYALPRYSSGLVNYRFYLEGYSHSWSAWSEAAQKDFTNLKQGDYRFLVQAMAADGGLSAVAEFPFTVLPPWYLSWLALLIYALLFVLLLVGIRYWYRYKIAKHRRLVQENLQREHAENMRQEALLNTQKLVQLKNQQLEKELSGKNRELTNSAMNIVYKNELLSNVHDELLQLKDEQGKKLSGEQLRKINKIIEDARSDERDWNLFENSFNETHENFFKKLKARYPDLVPNDLKLCAYLRMNMSSKEVASLLNISTRGVEIRRYRLRKKLDLPHDKNLAEFLIEL